MMIRGFTLPTLGILIGLPLLLGGVIVGAFTGFWWLALIGFVMLVAAAVAVARDPSMLRRREEERVRRGIRNSRADLVVRTGVIR